LPTVIFNLFKIFPLRNEKGGGRKNLLRSGPR
jgi:hypothetical protein